MKLKNIRKQQPQQFPWIYSTIKARHSPIKNIIIFPILQRNPINNCTVKGPDEPCEWPWDPEQLQWWRCSQHQSLRKVACSLVFFKCDPLVFPSCFIDRSHLVKPGWECSPKSTAQEVVKAKVSARQLSSSKGLVTAEPGFRLSALAACTWKVFCAHHCAHHAGKSSGGLSP